jgi:hypothetical protein
MSLLWLTLAALIVPTMVVVNAIVQTRASDSIQTAASNWTVSGHADFTSRSFNHWNDDDPPVIPVNCAACHSAPGMLDFLGERGTEAGSVSEAMPIGSVVSCVVCLNDAAHEMQSVTFPSGAVLDAWDVGESTCLNCHQGTESTVSANEAIGGLADDVVDNDLGFISVHYHVTAATIMGTAAQGGYQYDGLTYVGRFEHTKDFQTCHSCHDPHSLRVEPLQCSSCHSNV